MKLRNKKTGEVVDLSIFGIELNIRKEDQPIYRSLAELNEEWEDYEPKEPLVKDEKIRKAVRAWAEANGVEKVVLGQVNNDELVKKSPMTAFGCHISFESSLGLERGRNYTITELCGEEEE